MYWWQGSVDFEDKIRRIVKLQSIRIRNFGDRLSPIIINLLTGQPARHTTIGRTKLLALGSIFFALNDYDLVWGSGLLDSTHIKFALNKPNVKYYAVRGPETRKLLNQNGIDCPQIYGDPAQLLPYLIQNDLVKKYKIGIVPHFTHYSGFKQIARRNKDIKVINVQKPVIQVCQEILACEIILSSSLHGIILSESYGIPALMLTSQQPLHADFLKFEDYFHATGRSLTMARFTEESSIYRLENLALIQPTPKIDLNPLLRSFPFPLSAIHNTDFTQPSLKWSSFLIKSQG